MAEHPFQPYPAWKQLKAAIWPLLGQKSEFTYAELKELAGIDITTSQGRMQFYRFRKFALTEWNIWFENELKTGYRAIPPGQHSKAAVKRIGQARRRVNVAKSIQHHVKIEEMTPNERSLHAQTGALIDDVARTFHRAGRELAAVASKFKAIDMSAADLDALADAPAKKAVAVASKFKAIDMPEDAVKALTAKKAG